jgi:hypothetical protein
MPSASAYDLALTLGMLGLALLRARMIPMFAVAAAPFVARRLAPHLSRLRGLAAFALTSTLACAPAMLHGSSPPGIGFDGTSLPLGAVAYLRAHPVRGPVWNFLAYGGYLSWRLYPDVRVFIDGRTIRLYPAEFVADYERAESDPAAFAVLDLRYHFEWALVWAAPGEKSSRPIADDPAWVMTYLDDNAAIYMRKGGVNHALAADGYRVLNHLTQPGWPLAADLPAGPLAHDAQLARAQAPGSVRTHLFAAAACLANHDPGCVAAEHAWLVRTVPDHPALRLLEARMAGRSL